MAQLDYLPRIQGPDRAFLYLRLAEAITVDIRLGRLRPGDLLPGQRALAHRLHLGRNAVTAAYEELRRQGWLEPEARCVTRVAARLPEQPPPGMQGESPPAAFSFKALPGWVMPARVLPASSGTPDFQMAPAMAIARAFAGSMRRAARDARRGGAYSADQRLRETLGQLLALRRELSPDPERLALFTGLNGAMYLVARLCLSPGGRVAVEAPGNPYAWNTLQAAGADPVPVPIDAEGLVVEALERLHAHRPLSMVHLCPNHHLPTGAQLSLARRIQLLAWATATKVAILEQDSDSEFHYGTAPPLQPLAAMDRAGIVIHMGSLSKLLAPSFRLAYVHAPADLIRSLRSASIQIDPHGDPVAMHTVADLLHEGELQRQWNRLRQAYTCRRNTCLDVLTKKGGERVVFSPPTSGMGLWLSCINLNAERALSDLSPNGGLLVRPLSHFQWPGNAFPMGLRLEFSNLPPDQLRVSLEDWIQKWVSNDFNLGLSTSSV